MALSAAIIWNVQTGANANNGGGFKAGATGTDYSKQNSAQYSLTGGTSAGAGAVILHASASTDMVGNVANILSGTNATAGRREIISVVAGVSITFDANVTTGVGAAIALEVGGGVPSPGTIASIVIAGNSVYIKSGTAYTLTSTATFSPGTGLPVLIEGYTTTHGDHGIATITSATNSVALMQLNNSTTYTVRSIKFTHTAGTRGTALNLNVTNVTNVRVRDCEFDGCAAGISETAGSGVALFIDHCNIHHSVQMGLTVDGISAIVLRASWLHHNGTNGITVSGGNPCTIVAIKCLFTDNTADGWNAGNAGLNSQNYAFNCVFANNGSDGIEQSNTTSSQSLVAISNIFYGNTGLGIKWNATLAPALPILKTNAYGANSGGNYSSNVPAGEGDVTLSADPFVSSSDYSLNGTAGGGLACVDVGDPLTIP